jgi:hypothetical protein
MYAHNIFEETRLKRFVTLLFLMAIIVFALPAHAQEGEPSLSFRLNRDFGYGLGSRIQGTFSVSVAEDDNFSQIGLWIDEKLIDVDEEAPYRIRFSTSDFPPGVHMINVIGITTDGLELSGQPIRVDFLSSEQARSQTVKLVVPLLVLVAVVMLAGTLGPALFGRKKRRFQPGSYGHAGGSICPRCGLPFSRNLLSPNLGIGKLERCPHCGKWSIVRRASSSELEEAEAKLASTMSSGPVQPEDEDDNLRRMIDDSRYESGE